MTNTVPLTAAEIDAAYRSGLGLLDLPPSEWEGERTKSRPAAPKAAPAPPARPSALARVRTFFVDAAILAAAANLTLFLPEWLRYFGILGD